MPKKNNRALCELLLQKSQDAFLLAIEVYNRPTGRYRSEACAVLLCNAWELMLKAHLILKDGEKSIFMRNSTDTISLRQCLAKVDSNKSSPLRRNMERIMELRNASTHFFTEEFDIIWGPLLQACVVNYARQLSSLHGIDIAEKISGGHLVLASHPGVVDIETVQKRYPRTVAEQLISLYQETSREVDAVADETFAVRYRVDLALVKAHEDAIPLRITKDADQAAMFLNRHINVRDSYPLRFKDLLAAVNKRLRKSKIEPRFRGEALEAINRYQLLLLIDHLNLKQDASFTHNRSTAAEHPNYLYSQQCVDAVFEVIEHNPESALDSLQMLKNNSA